MVHPFADDAGDADGYCIVREEGGAYEWMSYLKWLRESAAAPICGVLRGDQLRLHDTVLLGLGRDPWRTMRWKPKVEGNPADLPGERIFHAPDAKTLAFADGYASARMVIYAYLNSLSDKARLNLARALTYPGIE